MVAHVAMETGFNFKDTQKSLNFLAEMVLDHHLALDFLLDEQGRVYALAKISCCTYINTSGVVEEHTKKF
jgi:hypothetical protein